VSIVNFRPTRTAAIVGTLALAIAATAGCSSGAGDGAGSAGGKGLICVDFPRSDTDFWNAFINYVPKYAQEMGLEITTTNSDNDVQKLVENVQTCISQGAKAVVMAPQDTAAVAPLLDNLESQNIPVVTLDTRPDAGKVAMVVRADNVSMGTQACEFLGEKMGGKGTAVELMGSQDSINGRDRTKGFEECMAAKYPNIKVSAQASEWESDKAASQLQTALASNVDVTGIYMASSFALAGTQQILEKAGLNVPPSDPKHVYVISGDGIPQELADIRDGRLDATVSQPADTYAKYGLSYAAEALEGKAFAVGPTDHDSSIVEVRDGILEDQLPSVTVTSANVDDQSLWGNQLGE
jgi:simple sugar transport system substrate-binding protein/ribose transport system substrate-binding protein